MPFIKEKMGVKSKRQRISDNPKEIIEKLLNLGIDGFGPLKSASDLGEEYLSNQKFSSNEERVEALIKNEMKKNFCSGFITSLGGWFMLPAMIPAALFANWVLQTRMVATLAYILGFRIDEGEVRMAIVVSLLGKNGKDVLNAKGPELIYLLQHRVFNQIPKRTMIEIYTTTGIRLLSTMAGKGFSRISKGVPFVGGFIGGSLDLRSCKETADFARELFQTSVSS